MKNHYRRIQRNTAYGDSFRVACGANVHWTKATTSDPYKVDCKRCQAFMAAEGRRDAKRSANAGIERPQKPQEGRSA